MIVIFLMIWLIPILIIVIATYIDMKKGQSIEEYMDEVDCPIAPLIIIAPIVNWLTALCLIVVTIYNKIKHFRK